jgi:hypothetical protein
MVFDVIQITKVEVGHLLPELAVGSDGGAGPGEVGYCEVAVCRIGVSVERKGDMKLTIASSELQCSSRSSRYLFNWASTEEMLNST